MPDGVSPRLFTIVDANKSGVEVKAFQNGNRLFGSLLMAQRHAFSWLQLDEFFVTFSEI
jgi:hypothetical protein